MDILFFLIATAIILLALTVDESQRHRRSQPRALPAPVLSRTQRQVATMDGYESRGRS
jgi:hypothetical protein